MRISCLWADYARSRLGCRWGFVGCGAMTMKRSQFGSLADRLGMTGEGAGPDRPVRHVWVDGTRAGLVIDRRRDALDQWEGLVVTVVAGQVRHEWVAAARITKVEA